MEVDNKNPRLYETQQTILSSPLPSVENRTFKLFSSSRVYAKKSDYGWRNKTLKENFYQIFAVHSGESLSSWIKSRYGFIHYGLVYISEGERP